MTPGQRFARLVTELAVRRPALWRVLRAPLRRMFDRLAPRWDSLRDADHLVPLETALARLEPAPRRALDLGTGTGAGALAVATRWPRAEVVGVDLSPAMVAEAERRRPPALADRVSFAVADAVALPYPDASFDLVTLANMIAFFDELARVLAPGGAAVLAFSHGADTPIYVPPERLRSRLAARGFDAFEEIEAGAGTALVSRKRATG